MPPHQRGMANLGLPSAREIVRDVPYVLRESFTARFAVLGLTGVLVYLIIGQIVRPGFTDYWWYQIFQTSATLLIVLFFNAAFASEGGMAIQTHIVVIGATLADTIGTAFGFYHSWGPYDKVVHFASGAAFAAGTYQALNYLSRRGILEWGALKRAGGSFAASLFVTGFVWETYEYMGDAVFNSGRVQSRGDTVGDLIADTLGAAVAVGLVYQYERRHQREMDEQAAEAATPALAEPGRALIDPTFKPPPDRDYAMSRSHASMDD
ncbi:MAG: hypothetical protein IT334_07370 [Thermomicrobiales bacterium]|nr:hypothetical protein [Thermomicrobiales bacterium]